MILIPKGWDEFQHYKSRSPIWIKLHRKLLDNYEFHCLPVASRALAPMLWLLASEYDGGKIDAPISKVAFRVRLTENELLDALKPLVDADFFEDASNVLAGCKQDACLEKRREREREETEKEKNGADALFSGGVILAGEALDIERPVYGPPATITNPEPAVVGQAKAGGIPMRFAFEGDVIRLKQKDFDKWTEAFPMLDLRAELTARDAWLATQPDHKNWFVSTSQYLANRSRKIKQEADRKHEDEVYPPEIYRGLQ